VVTSTNKIQISNVQIKFFRHERILFHIQYVTKFEIKPICLTDFLFVSDLVTCIKQSSFMLKEFYFSVNEKEFQFLTQNYNVNMCYDGLPWIVDLLHCLGVTFVMQHLSTA